MSTWQRARRRWSELSRRAAVSQSNILLWVLYWIVVTPIGAVRRLIVSAPAGPHWHARPAETDDALTAARRQY